jgi:hypothetical protein
VNKFDEIERVVTMHWLDDVPLWGCPTGLRKDADGIDDGDKGYYQG